MTIESGKHLFKHVEQRVNITPFMLEGLVAFNILVCTVTGTNCILSLRK